MLRGGLVRRIRRANKLECRAVAGFVVANERAGLAGSLLPAAGGGRTDGWEISEPMRICRTSRWRCSVQVIKLPSRSNVLEFDIAR